MLGGWWMKIRPGGCDPGEQGFQWEDHTGPPKSWEGTKIDPVLEAIQVEEFLQVFFPPVNSFYSIITPSFFHYYLQIWPVSWMRDWRSRVFSQRSKNKPWLVVFLDFALTLINLSPSPMSALFSGILTPHLLDYFVGCLLSEPGLLLCALLCESLFTQRLCC